MLSARRVPRVVVGVAVTAAARLGTRPKLPRCSWSASRSPKRMMSSSLPAVVAHRAVDGGQQVQLGRHSIRIGLHVDQGEGEGLGRGRSADAKRRHQRLVTEAARRILDEMHRRAIDLHARPVEQHGVVLRQAVAIGDRIGGEVVAAAQWR